jgi:hypothetical protein
MKKTGKNGNNDKSEDVVYTVVIYEWTLVAEEAKATGEFGMQYVGQTDDPNSRMQGFYNENADYSVPGSKIDKARHKFGTDKANWRYKELHRRQYKSKSLSIRRGDELETKEIIKHNSVEKGLNTSYGRGMKGLHHSEESRQKISQALKGVKKSEAHKKAMSEGKKKAKRRRERELRRQQKQQALSAAA